MTHPVARKLGMNPGMRALVIGPPAGYLKLLRPLPDGLTVSSRSRRDVPLRAGFCDAPLANNEVRPETLETRGSERFGMDFVPKENVESQRGPKSRRNPRSDVERRVACRVHRCYRRGLVSITFPAGWPSRRALEARPGLSSGRQPLNSRIVTSELPIIHPGRPASLEPDIVL